MKKNLLFLCFVLVLICGCSKENQEFLNSYNSNQQITSTSNKQSSTKVFLWEDLKKIYPKAYLVENDYKPIADLPHLPYQIYLDTTGTQFTEIYVYNKYDYALDVMRVTCDKVLTYITLPNGQIHYSCSGQGNECGVEYNSSTGGTTIVKCFTP